MVYCTNYWVYHKHRGKDRWDMTQGRVSHKGNHSVAELDNVVTDSRDGRTLLCPVSQVASLSGVKEGREGGLL